MEIAAAQGQMSRSLPIFSRAATTWRRHVPKRQCAIIVLSC
jgi:hypothetical protein